MHTRAAKKRALGVLWKQQKRNGGTNKMPSLQFCKPSRHNKDVVPGNVNVQQDLIYQKIQLGGKPGNIPKICCRVIKTMLEIYSKMGDEL